MSSIECVLVLGAGASRDYGLPIGRELIEEIKETLRKNPVHLLQSMVGNQFEEHDFENLLYSLERLRSKTIDEYLQGAALKTVLLGKYLIAETLLRKEAEGVARIVRGMEDSWLELFVERLERMSNEHRKRVGVITFNYDRLLEYQIISGLWAKSVHEAREIDANEYPRIQIEHVHGSLGVARPDRAWCIDGFKNAMAEGRIREAAHSFAVVADPAADPAFSRARAMLSNAKRVMFLGFGFHPNNLSRLGLIESSKAEDRRIAATCHNLDGHLRREVERGVRSKIEWLETATCSTALNWLEGYFREFP